MKKGIYGALIGVFLAASLLVVCASQAEEAKMTVLNPRGQLPALALVPMAPRLDTLDGKTVYIVDVRFPGCRPFFEEMQKLFAERYPKVKTVLREKAGPYLDDDRKLWAEIKEKGDAMIMAMGH